jgi:LysM repeat protein
MTTPVDEPAAPSRAPEPTTPAEPAMAAPTAPSLAIDLICPYLLAANREWRSASPSREHRCTAVDPPAPLAADKQRALCLVRAHSGCPAFRAARTARALLVAPGVDPKVVAAADAARRPIARSTAVVLERPWLSIGSIGGREWPAYQALLVVLMVAAFGVLLVARLSAGGTAPTPTPSPSAVATASPTATPRPTQRPTPSPSPSGAAPSGSIAPGSPGPSVAFQTYRVQSGDTLVGIAATFGTTVAELQQLNGLTGSELRIGQLLKIP